MAPPRIKGKGITRSQVDLVHCVEHASASCRCTVRASCWWWTNERSNNLLRVRSVRIGDDQCVNTVLLETQGRCGSVRRCRDDIVHVERPLHIPGQLSLRQRTNFTSVQVKCHSTHAVPIHMPHCHPSRVPQKEKYNHRHQNDYFS